jgi:hypothetical protein
MIAAGVNAKALATYEGHSSITVTLDRYGHLMPGNEVEAAGMLASYLEREAGFGVALFAGLAGLFSRQATDRLGAMLDTAFATRPKLGEARPTITSPLDPTSIKTGAPNPSVLISGTGFTTESKVTVNGKPRSTTLENGKLRAASCERRADTREARCASG